jgi:hypothetical protein
MIGNDGVEAMLFKQTFKLGEVGSERKYCILISYGILCHCGDFSNDTSCE